MSTRFLPRLSQLGNNERRVFLILIAMNIIGGLGDGMMAQNELAFLKSLHGTKEMLAFITQVSTMSCLLIMVYNEILKRIQDKRRFLVWVTVIARLPLLLFAFYPNQAAGVVAWHAHLFVCSFIFMGFLGQMVGPATNAMLKQNFTHENFGMLISVSTSFRTGAMLMTTILSGVLMDRDPFAFRYIYPLVGLAGMLAGCLLLWIPFQAETVTVPAGGWHPWRLLRESMATTKRIFEESRPFRDFEFGFVLYGFAMLGTSAIISNMLAKEMDISYTENGVYRMLAGIITVLAFPLAGLWIGKIDPRRFLAITCLTFIGYLGFLGLACFVTTRTMIHGVSIHWILVIAFMFSGIFSAMIVIAWGIGSAYFCKPEQVADYQSVHVYMTSIRGILAPPIGIGLMWLTGKSWVVLGFGILALISSIAWLNFSIRQRPFSKHLHGENEAVFDDTATRENG
jgi:MFS family permease